MLHELSPGGLWVSERAVWFGGVRLRSRMTVLRLASDSLWIHSASTPTPDLCEELDRLGQVRWIVVPNRWHHLHAAAMKTRYPGAQLLGPTSARLRNDRLVLDDDIDGAGVPGVTSVPLRGVPFLDETLFFHDVTRTLIGADLMMCGCPADHWTWRLTSRVLGQFGKYKTPPDVRWNTRGGPLVQQSLEEMARLPVERILVAHSDPIEDRPLEQLEEAWRFARQ